jgi:hypothetical protein
MKTTLIGILMAACAFAQNSPSAECGAASGKFKVSRDKSQHPAPAADSSKAIVYILGTGSFVLDGKWVGAVNGTYSFLELDPGEHHFCAEFTMRVPFPYIKIHRASAHSLDAQPSRTYYFYAYDNPRDYYDFTLKQLDPDEGARIVSATSFSTSHPKQ